MVISVVTKRANLIDADADGDGEPDISPLDGLPEGLRKQFEKWFEQQSPGPHGQRKRSNDDDAEPQFNGQGSGIIVREDGYVLSNNHVVGNAEKIRVRLKDGREFDAEIKGQDPKSDLAVIKLKGDVRGLKAAKFADSDKVRVGEFAIAIGAPFELDYSITFGHVSAKGRDSVAPTPSRRLQAMDQDFIQTDASINPGNSGGPLVSIDGEVIGINTMILGLHSGIGFAIPSSHAQRVCEAIIESGHYSRSWLGIGIGSLRQDTDYRAMVKDIRDGVVVYSVQENGPAAKTDLRRGDVITSVDGKKVATQQQLMNEVRKRKVGSIVLLDVHRKGKNLAVKVKTEELPDQVTPVLNKRQAPVEDEQNVSDFGVKVKTITDDLATRFNIKKREGVVISEIDADSLAARRGLRVGDVISEVNDLVVSTPKEFVDAMKDVNLKSGVSLTVTSERDGVARFMTFREK